jgi:hypothetical protein
MIELTQEQQQALAGIGAMPPTVIDPTTKETYILVRAAVYQRLQRLPIEALASLLERPVNRHDEKDVLLELCHYE